MKLCSTLFASLFSLGLVAQCPGGIFPDLGFDAANYNALQFTVQLSEVDIPAPAQVGYLAAFDPDQNMVGCGVVSSNGSIAVGSMFIYFDCDNAPSGVDLTTINCNASCGDCENFTLVYYDLDTMTYAPILSGVNSGPATEFIFEDLNPVDNVVDGYTASEAVTGVNTTAVDSMEAFTTLGDVIAFLPVELSTFTARVVRSQVHLNWVTASEIANDYFEVQHSTDGRNYDVIGRLSGAGTSHEPQYYSFVDANPADQNYYRLRQVDFDGTASLSPIVVAALTSNGPKDVKLFPNPVNEASLSLNFSGMWNEEELVNAQLHDSNGRRVAEWIGLNPIGQVIELPQGLPAGMYNFSLIGSRQLYQERLIINR
ncbi:MAG: T9SS type A sorting domain-containing protein [Bacteroidota bacterium]